MGATKTGIDYAIQVLEKVNIPCLYRSKVSGVFYEIFNRTGEQVKRSLKTKDKELARRRLEELRQKVCRLNTKAGTTNHPAVRQSRISPPTPTPWFSQAPQTTRWWAAR
ncbi:MAG: hypothetical protein WA117_10865 [Verrucomicrobiia bacterium]